MTIRTALAQGSELLGREGIAEPRLTAEVLLSHAIHCDRTYFYAHPEQELREVEWLHYGRYLDERMKGKPTQYITRNAGVLWPRVPSLARCADSPPRDRTAGRNYS